MTFDHKAIEAKWQAAWAANKQYEVADSVVDKENKYILVEFPYPSGDLHVGHWYAFAVTDVIARYQSMMGYNVLFPIGFDAFGLPAENAAIKRGLDPREWTYANMESMQRQMHSMGTRFDWSRHFATCDPAYYRWTQFLVTKLFENNLLYRSTQNVNWCPSCNTVLANEQVVGGRCERCDNEVEQKQMPQWSIKITKYADRLVDDLEKLDWPESIKESQRNWIGRNRGAEIDFTLSTGDTVTAFTTRPDTLFGATYLVLAPEHPLLEKCIEHSNSVDDVRAYQKRANNKTDLERQENREKTGVELSGITATNPATGKAIPVWIADYVLAHYGTGAIMAVPAHDERDREFAEKFDLPIVDVILPDTRKPFYQKTKEIISGKTKVTEIERSQVYSGEGKLINSGEFDGMDSEVAKEAITKHVGGRMTNTYRLRDWSIGRQRYWGCPIPIVYDPTGAPHIVPEEHLPWMLPDDVDYTPDGTAPLARSKELRERTERIFGAGWTPEVETMDTFIDSAWYFLRYIDPNNTTTFMSKEAEAAWMPVDFYSGGAEHTTMHLLYSRFFQKALYDIGLVTHDEPYTKRLNRGLILGPDGNKMSKSKGNVINPDAIVERLGADTVRTYLAFIGPYNEVGNYPWDPDGIVGVRRFLERVVRLHEKVVDGASDDETILRVVHQTIKKVGDEIESTKLNTGVAALMTCVKHLEKVPAVSSYTYRTLVQLLAPFAPHIAEELWERLGGEGSVHESSWPDYDESLLVSDSVTYAVQVNGKVRGTFEGAKDMAQESAEKEAQALPSLEKHLAGKTVDKIIFVPGRLINFVVK